MPAPVYRITTAGHEPTPEQRRRALTYLIMMGVRFVAVILAVIVPGWWRLVPVALGVVLPYVAVVLVNAANTKQPGQPGVTVAQPAAPAWRPHTDEPPGRPRA